MGEEQNHQGILHEIYIGSQGHRCCRHVRFGSISGVAPAADFPATILGQGTRAVCSSCSPSKGVSHLLVSQRGGGGAPWAHSSRPWRCWSLRCGSFLKVCLRALVHGFLSLWVFFNCVRAMALELEEGAQSQHLHLP